MKTALKDVITNNIKAWRSRRGLSQMKLAELADLSSGYIGDIESGKTSPSIRSIELIAAALEIKPYILLLSSNDEVDDNSEILDSLRDIIHRYSSE